MKIDIACKGSGVEDHRTLVELQGEAKVISRENLDKLKGVIVERGFFAPVFVWRKPDGTKYVVDGHQRLKAVRELEGDGYEIPELPVVEVEADSEKDAREKLLYVSSQYGEFNMSGVYEFVEGLDIDLETVRLMQDEFDLGEIDFDIDTLLDEVAGQKERHTRTFTCPHCGKEFEA